MLHECIVGDSDGEVDKGAGEKARQRREEACFRFPVRASVCVHDEENGTATDRFARCFAFEARAIVRESDDRLK